jgi:hypothetical protein
MQTSFDKLMGSLTAISTSVSRYKEPEISPKEILTGCEQEYRTGKADIRHD